MADENGLKIRIGADLGEAIKQVSLLTGGVIGLGKAAAVPISLKPLNTAGLSASVAKLKVDIASLPAASSNVNSSLAKIQPGANQAAQALQNLGRVAQDAPFGFIGIANNINPLLESFQRLKAETGTTGGAIKALAGSLLGGGGLGLAFSAITAAVSFASIGFDNWTRGMTDSGKAAKKTKEEVNGIAEAIGNATAEASRVQSLAASVLDLSKSLSDRNRALDELKNTNESYFGNLKIEDGLYDNLTSKVNEYARALILANVQKAKGEDLTKASIAEQDIRSQISDLDSLISKRTQLAKSRFEELKAKNLLDLSGKQSVFDILKNDDVQKEAITKRIALYEQLGAATDNLGKLSIAYDAAVQASLSVQSIEKPGKAKKEVDTLKEAIKNLEAYQQEVGLTEVQFQKLIDLKVQLAKRDQVKNGWDDGQLKAYITSQQASNDLLEVRKRKLEDLSKTVQLLQGEKIEKLNIEVEIALNDLATGKLDLNQAQRTLDALAKSANLSMPVSLSFDKSNQEVLKARSLDMPVLSVPVKVSREDLGVKEAVKAINTDLALTDIKPIEIDINTTKATAAVTDLNASINSAIQKMAAEAAFAIGESLGTALAGGDTANVLGNFMGVLADGLKEIGKAMIVFATARIALAKGIQMNPYVALAAGVGLVAAGAALQTTMNKRRFAEGGIIASPQDIRVGEAGPEVVFPLTNLESVLSRISGNRSNEGGFVASTSISGAHLNILIHRAKNQSGNSFSF